IVAGVGNVTPHAIPISQLSPSDRYRFGDQQWYTLDGQVVTSGLDENGLIALKNEVGGRYVHVKEPGDFAMGSLISNVDVKRIKGEREVFMYPLMAALLFAALALLSVRERSQRDLRLDWRKLTTPFQRRWRR
ncbi:MAG: hypothetical protein ACRD3W_11235, partial [Terriglobales bacterium]